MLKVKTKLKISNIPGAGLGLFADEFIPKGTVIWELDVNLDRLISKKQFEEMPEVYKDFISTYGYTISDYPFIILCGDNARFVNHSRPGNMIGDHNIPYGDMHISIASKDILPDEEITEDYAIFDDKSMDPNKPEDYY